MNSINKLFEIVLENRVLAHVLYWCGIIVFNCVYSLGYNRPVLVTLILLSITLPFTIIAAYVFMYWQFPLIQKRKYLLFGLSFMGISYLFSTLAHINYDFGMGTKLISWHKPHDLFQILVEGEFVFSFLVDIYPIVFITMGIKLFKDQYESRSYILKLETEAAFAESKLLISRLQPEFLLNSILLIKKQSVNQQEKTPQTIENLSEILDYTLYKSDQESVSASVELTQLRRYLKLSSDITGHIEFLDFDIQQLDPLFKIRPLTFVRIAEIILQDQYVRALDQMSLSVFATSEINGSVLQIAIDTKDSNADFSLENLGINIRAFLDSICHAKFDLRITTEETKHILFLKFYN